MGFNWLLALVIALVEVCMVNGDEIERASRLTSLIASTLEVIDQSTRASMPDWVMDFAPIDALLNMDVNKFSEFDYHALRDKNDRQMQVFGDILLKLRFSKFMQSIDWDIVGNSLPQSLRNLQPGSLDESIFARMNVYEFALLSPAQINRISNYELFAKIPIRHWKEFGPQKFSYLESQVVKSIPKFVFKSLGRNFLENLPDKQLEWLLSSEEIEDQKIEGVDEERKRMRYSMATAIEITRNLQPEDVTLIDERLLMTFPWESIKEMDPRTRQALPSDFASSRTRNMEQGYSTLLTFLSVLDLFKLPWAALATWMTSAFFNGLDHEMIQKVPWSRMWAFMPDKTISSLSEDLLLNIPSVHFSKLPINKFLKLDNEVIINLPVEHINGLPDAAISSLTAEQIEKLGADKFNKISLRKLKVVAWADIMRDFNVTFFNRLEPQVIQIIPPEAFVALTPQLFGSLDSSRVRVLSVAQLNSVPLAVWKVTFAEALKVIGRNKLAQLDAQVKKSLSRAELARLDPKYAQALGRAVEVQKWIDFLYRQRLVEVNEVTDKNKKDKPLGAGIGKLTLHQIRELDWIKIAHKLRAEDISHLSPDKVKSLGWPFLFSGLAKDQLRRIEPRVMSNINPRDFASIRRKHVSKFSPEQFRYVTPQQARFFPSDSCSAISAGILINLPPSSFTSLSLACMKAIGADTFAALPKSSWEALPPRTQAALHEKVLSGRTTTSIRPGRRAKDRTIVLAALRPVLTSSTDNRRQII